MKNPRSSEELATLLEQRRRALSERPDVSARMRLLSQSSGRNPLPPQKSKRPPLLTVVIASTAALALLLCALGSVAVVASGVWVQNQLNDPVSAEQGFYSALHEKDYHRAYSLYSDAAQSHTDERTFTDRYSTFDQIEGVVTSYTVVKSVVGDTTATLTVQVVRQGDTDQARIETLALVKHGNTWRIDSVALGKTVPLSGTPTH